MCILCDIYNKHPNAKCGNMSIKVLKDKISSSTRFMIIQWDGTLEGVADFKAKGGKNKLIIEEDDVIDDDSWQLSDEEWEEWEDELDEDGDDLDDEADDI